MAEMILKPRERKAFYDSLAMHEWLRLSVWVSDYCRKRIVLQDAEDTTWARSVQHPEWSNERRV